MVAYSKLLPIFVVTGYLGSGKTTLINHMLQHPSLSDAAVLVNEFGDVGIDHMLVQKMDEGTVLLQSGCICCTIRSDLKDSIIELNSKRESGDIPPYKRLILETTGLADPSPILFTLNSDTVIKHHYRLGSVITTVDSVNGFSQMKRRNESVKQVLVADRLVLTKGDLVNASSVQRLESKLNRLNPTADIIPVIQGKADVISLLRADVYEKRTKGAEVRRWIAPHSEADYEELSSNKHDNHKKHDINKHDKSIRSFTITYDEPIDWTAFGIWLTMLLNRHGENVLRVKGILNIKDVNTPVIINGVQHVVHPPIHLKSWPTQDHRSHIVFIVDGIEQSIIKRSLKAFNRLTTTS